jgi:DNA-binding LacI/PurR family transcriptional regulator/DNA-binding transcriptional regulator YhcF (GntR family)
MEMNFGKIDTNSSQTLYLQITKIIENKILNKEIPVGEKLPVHEDLCKIFNVSSYTIKEALSSLVRDGYISRRPNHGTVIISSKPKNLDFKVNNGICVVSCGYMVRDPKHPDDFGEHASLSVQSLIFGIEEKIKELGGYLIFTTMGKSGFQIAGKEKDIAGLILMGNITPRQFREVKKLNIPLVLTDDLNQKKKTSSGVNVVASDDFQAGYMAAKHLTGLGHKKIALFAKKRYYSIPYGMDMVKGYRKACKEADKGFTKDREIMMDETKIGDGYKRMKKLLKKPLPFTAVVCISKPVWEGASEALKEKGLTIPRDLSVVDVGDIQGLTRVAFNNRKIGNVVVEQLIKRIKNPDLKPERIVVQPVLLEKGSTKKV